MNMRVYDEGGFGGLKLPSVSTRVGGYEGLQVPSYSGLSNYGLGVGNDSSYLTGSMPSFDSGVDVGAVMDRTPASFSWTNPTTWQGGLQRLGVTDSIDPMSGNKLNGWGGLALNTIGGLGQAFMGMKTYGLAKDQFRFQKNAWNKEFAAQKGLINSQLEDRQKRRVAEQPGQHDDVASYMSKYGVK